MDLKQELENSLRYYEGKFKNNETMDYIKYTVNDVVHRFLLSTQPKDLHNKLVDFIMKNLKID